MINEKQAKWYCKEDISKIENYENAIADTTQTWHLHHRDEVKILPSGIEVRRSREELIENDRYYHCPANELIFLTKAEHTRLHTKGKQLSEESKIKIGEANKGNKPANKGKPISEFGEKFKQHYGKTRFNDVKLYNREHKWYREHGRVCRWESR